jgi:hypothetical protein
MSSLEEAKREAQREVAECEKEIGAIKATVKSLTTTGTREPASSGGADSSSSSSATTINAASAAEAAAGNTLTVVLLKASVKNKLFCLEIYSFSGLIL